MPIHFHDLDITPELEGVRSALIVPCNMCPAVTVSLREQRPFMKVFRSIMTSAPFEEYIGELQSRLEEQGVHAKVFKSRMYHNWFMCMWTAGRQNKLRKYAKHYDSVIVLGCESATVTVRDAVSGTDCKVIEGMKVSGIMNAKLRFHFPGNLSFEDCKVIPLSH
jgi:hypothetical protein